MVMRLVRAFWSIFGDDILRALSDLMVKMGERLIRKHSHPPTPSAA